MVAGILPAVGVAAKILGPLLPGPIGKTVSSVIAAIDGNNDLTDEQKQVQAQQQFEILKQENDIKVKELELQKASVQGNVDLNKIDAKSNDKVQKYWRPFIGWTIGISLFHELIIARYIGAWLDIPPLGDEKFQAVLWMAGGLLGLVGGMRSLEKIFGKN